MTKAEATVPVALLAQLFVLNEDGSLTWRRRPAEHFQPSLTRTAQHIAANWNALYAGTPALACVDQSGHRTGRINGRLFYSHRVVWAMHTGAWPTHEIDHINGIADDNRPCNLRDVPHVLNLRNQATRSTNTTGLTGVHFYRRDQNWRASITVNGREKHLGYFATREAAHQARIEAERMHGFHSNHGRARA